MKIKPGNTYIYHNVGSKVDFLVVLLSSDIEPGWETNENVWRCAQFQIGNKVTLLGAQVVLFTESELLRMTESKPLSTLKETVT